MKILRCGEIVEATEGILLYGSSEQEIMRISTDSRSVQPGSLFVPIKGERFDGHNFIKDALAAGAAGTLTQYDLQELKCCPEHEGSFDGKLIIKVNDTLKALRDIAAYYRQMFRIPFTGITGSVGKTSTKDMIACVLEQEYNVLKTMGNFNNEIGVPLTIFNLNDSYEAAVVEMGMSGFGEISRLTSIVKPKIAVITNIGMSHMEKLGSRQNILKAKMEIFEGLPRDGLVVMNGDDTFLYGLKGFLNFRTLYYGMDEGLDYQAYNVQSAGETGIYFDINVKNVEYKVHVPVPGIHNVYNALAAIAVGVESGISMKNIIQGIRNFIPGKMRLNIVKNNGIKVINDAYNASPQSIDAALKVLIDLEDVNRRIAVLGDVLELGEWARQAHLDIGKLAFNMGIDYIITVGENGRYIAEGALESGASVKNVNHFSDNKEVTRFLEDFITDGDAILVKGSRGMKMEEIVEQLIRGENA
ncbi:MAG TPA: UDP-N-acetylmuramoyl-tripeptide--D-alanyl-D-alanine ligase [Clostridiales bacterium]|nr:UDP-N-acetylmuramoyl-tripeptide--D-alanyl-D-alanine ligase [Clostridiales bacterium]